MSFNETELIISTVAPFNGTSDNIVSQIFALVIIGIGLCVCVPIMTIYFLRYYRLRRNIMISKRYAICTLVIYIIIMIDMIVLRPLWLLLEVGYFDNRKTGNKYGWDIVLWLIVIFYSPIYYSFSISITWKFWLLYYDIKYAKSSQNGEWKEIIAPRQAPVGSVASSSNSMSAMPSISSIIPKMSKSRSATDTKATRQWFLLNVSTFGNFKWITIRICIVTVFFLIISYILWIYGYVRVINDPSNPNSYDTIIGAQTFDFLSNCISLFALIAIYYHIPVFYDHFYVRDELRLVFICLMVYYASVIILYITLMSSDHLPTVSTVFGIVHSAFATIAQFAVIMIQTLWVLKKIKPYLRLQSRISRNKSKLQMKDLIEGAQDFNEEIHAEKAIQNNLKHQLGSDTDDVKDNDDDYHKMQPEFTMSDLLEHPVGFNAFMMHLIKEFSMECLLSFIEFMQFIDFIVRKCPDINTDDLMDIIGFPSNVPLSHIIADKDELIPKDNKAKENVLSPRKYINNASNFIHKKKISTTGTGIADNIIPIKNDEETQLKISFEILSIGSDLYYKYIRTGSDLEINISGPLRKAFVACFENKEWKIKRNNNNKNNNDLVDVSKILSLYNKASKQMKQLLNFSFGRFKVKQDYDRLKSRCMSDVGHQSRTQETLQSTSALD